MANLPTAGASGADDLTQRFALDLQGFDAMRRDATASPKAGLKQVATQFDAMFAQMMLKSMRDATPQDGVFDSNTSKLYTSMLDQQLSQQMAGKGLGVADALMKQLMRNENLGGAQGGAAGGAGGMSAAMNAMGSDEGGLAASNALAQALASAKANNHFGGNGYSAESALTPPVKGNGASPDQDSFVGKVADAAQAASAATGIPARFIVGQAALESGWGKREIRGRDGQSSYNIFGIKATKNWTGRTVSAVTTEYVNGQPHRVVAQFRAYDSYQHAMTDYATMLKSNPRYAGVLSTANTPEGFANGMQRAGYATDPHYAKKLISILRQIV
ncbi:MAG: flagellar assembly peptidoglycan hydrolase FlgJ [Burkholderia gladioli]